VTVDPLCRLVEPIRVRTPHDLASLLQSGHRPASPRLRPFGRARPAQVEMRSEQRTGRVSPADEMRMQVFVQIEGVLGFSGAN
jgi:hypothetical protein